MKKVLIIDDDEQVRVAFSGVLQNEHITTILAHDGLSGLNLFAAEEPDVVLLDLMMPGMNGIDVLKKLKLKKPHIPIIIITAHGDIPTAVEAIKSGAYDFLLKPPALDQLAIAVHRAINYSYLCQENYRLRKGFAASLEDLFGVSIQAKMLSARIAQLAGTNLTVVIEGETGTGKSYVARAIHDFSIRTERTFVKVDMGTIAESIAESELFGHGKGAFTGAERQKTGYIEAAHGGTIFIDEIENMSPLLQSKMLRVVEEKVITPMGETTPVAVDVRIVAATNSSLKKLVSERKFRDDLYFRLSEFIIRIPPLRERIEDIVHYANRFLDEARADFQKNVQLSADALAKVQGYHWPGNVRELKNVIRRAVFLAEDGLIGPDHIDFLDIGDAPALTDNIPLFHSEVKSLEKRLIESALRSSKGKTTKAAELLGIDYKTITKKMKELGIVSQ